MVLPLGVEILAEVPPPLARNEPRTAQTLAETPAFLAGIEAAGCQRLSEPPSLFPRCEGAVTRALAVLLTPQSRRQTGQTAVLLPAGADARQREVLTGVCLRAIQPVHLGGIGFRADRDALIRQTLFYPLPFELLARCDPVQTALVRRCLCRVHVAAEVPGVRQSAPERRPQSDHLRRVDRAGEGPAHVRRIDHAVTGYALRRVAGGFRPREHRTGLVPRPRIGPPRRIGRSGRRSLGGVLRPR